MVYIEYKHVEIHLKKNLPMDRNESEFCCVSLYKDYMFYLHHFKYETCYNDKEKKEEALENNLQKLECRNLNKQSINDTDIK